MNPDDFAPSLSERTPERGARGDEGYTFTEILVSLVLMGVLMSAVMAGMFTAIAASRISHSSADLDAVLAASADEMGDQLFVACPDNVTPNAYLQFVQAGADAVGWPHSTVQIVGMKYWDPYALPGISPWTDTNGINGTCDNAAWLSSAKTMQKVIIEATTPDGSDSRVLEIVMTDIRKAKG